MPAVKYLRYVFIGLCLTLLLAVLIQIVPVSQGRTIYTIDMDKVVQAHKVLVGKAVNDDYDALLSINNISENITNAITAIAGDSLVIAAPIVASELNNDITDLVIDYLGLDTDFKPFKAPAADLRFPDVPNPEDFDPDALYDSFMKFNKKKQEGKEQSKIAKKVEEMLP